MRRIVFVVASLAMACQESALPPVAPTETETARNRAEVDACRNEGLSVDECFTRIENLPKDVSPGACRKVPRTLTLPAMIKSGVIVRIHGGSTVEVQTWMREDSRVTAIDVWRNGALMARVTPVGRGGHVTGDARLFDTSRDAAYALAVLRDPDVATGVAWEAETCGYRHGVQLPLDENTGVTLIGREWACGLFQGLFATLTGALQAGGAVLGALAWPANVATGGALGAFSGGYISYVLDPRLQNLAEKICAEFRCYELGDQCRRMNCPVGIFGGAHCDDATAQMCSDKSGRCLCRIGSLSSQTCRDICGRATGPNCGAGMDL